MSTDLILYLIEHRGPDRDMHESRQPVEDWASLSDFYANVDILRRHGLEWVELYLMDDNTDEEMVLLKRWSA